MGDVTTPDTDDAAYLRKAAPDAHTDGCAADMAEAPLDDGDIDGFVMFADVADDPAAIEARRLDLLKLGGAEQDA